MRSREAGLSRKGFLRRIAPAYGGAVDGGRLFMKDIAAVIGSLSGLDTQQNARLENAWATIRAGLRRDIGARMFDQWLKAAQLGDYSPESQTLDLLFASDFSANFVSG